MYEKQLLSLIENLEKAKQTFLKAHVKTQEAFVEWLKRSVIPYLQKKNAELGGPPNVEYRRVVKTLLNMSTSIYEGILSGNADLGDAVTLGKEFQLAIAQIEVIRESKEKAIRDTHIMRGGDPTHVPKVLQVDQEKGKDHWENMSHEGKQVLQKYSQWALELPKDLKKNSFVIKRLPVVPLMPKGADIEKLRKLRIATDHIAYYPILLNQQVLGLNSRWVAENFSGQGLKAAEFVVEMLEEKTGIQTLLTGDPVGLGDGIPRKLGGTHVEWFWIPAAKDIEKLRKAAYGQNVSIKRWGFPFNA